jgi:hypothetical protein
MTLILATSAPSKKRAPIKKKVFDWAELNAFLSNPPPAFDSDLGRHVFGMATNSFRSGMWAQIGERLVAVAHVESIFLSWAANPPGTPASHSSWSPRVEVRPAAGGRTSYSIDTSCNGWLAAKHLPVTRDEVGSRSRFRRKIFMYGQAGVYQHGAGPVYGDAGPDIANYTLDKFCSNLTTGEGIAAGLVTSGASEEWRGLAAALCQKVSAAVAPFKDCVVRFEEYAENGRALRLCLMRGDHHADLHPNYGVRIRIKLPCSWEEGRSREVPDFSVFICGPLGLMEKERVAYYGAELLHPNGRYQATALHESNDSRLRSNLDHLLYTGTSEVVEAARQWAANHIYIPC